MDEVDAGPTGAPTAPQPGAAPQSLGATLRALREAQGLSLAEVGARTRVPLRHLEAIEAADYAALPAPTYAVGFARAYARAIGADEVATAKAARIEVDRLGRRQPEYEPYEVTDPARVPSRAVAIVAAGLALGLLVLVALYFGGDWLQRSSAPSLPDAAPVVATRAVPAPTPTAAAGSGEVVLTATDEVWLRVYDAADTTLKIGTMQPGERYVVPATATDPQINVGRPDKLAVTLNGAAVPPLGTGERPIKDVHIGPAALAARLAGTPVPQPVAVPSATAAASPEPAAAPRRTVRRERSRPRRRVLTETQRANLEAARNLARPRPR
ncbi:helix-turn-helix domain-containing protein [Sphingomonas sp.]|uniref:helix-turn-helix domain-containing protein n=1 Tax=Sphingomonas sp. TaxID=28214 RepID=UPI0035BBBA8C